MMRRMDGIVCHQGKHIYTHIEPHTSVCFNYYHIFLFYSLLSPAECNFLSTMSGKVTALLEFLVLRSHIRIPVPAPTHSHTSWTHAMSTIMTITMKSIYNNNNSKTKRRLRRYKRRFRSIFVIIGFYRDGVATEVDWTETDRTEADRADQVQFSQTISANWLY